MPMITKLCMEENKNTTKIRAEPYTPGQCNAKSVSFNQICIVVQNALQKSIKMWQNLSISFHSLSHTYLCKHSDRETWSQSSTTSCIVLGRAGLKMTADNIRSVRLLDCGIIVKVCGEGINGKKNSANTQWCTPSYQYFTGTSMSTRGTYICTCTLQLPSYLHVFTVQPCTMHERSRVNQLEAEQFITHFIPIQRGASPAYRTLRQEEVQPAVCRTACQNTILELVDCQSLLYHYYRYCDIQISVC